MYRVVIIIFPLPNETVKTIKVECEIRVIKSTRILKTSNLKLEVTKFEIENQYGGHCIEHAL